MRPSVCDHWTQRKVTGKRKVTVDREKWREKDKTTVGWRAFEVLKPRSWEPNVATRACRHGRIVSDRHGYPLVFYINYASGCLKWRQNSCRIHPLFHDVNSRQIFSCVVSVPLPGRTFLLLKLLEPYILYWRLAPFTGTICLFTGTFHPFTSILHKKDSSEETGWRWTILPHLRRRPPSFNCRDSSGVRSGTRGHS